MNYHFALSPDVNVQNISDWFIFNTKIQRITGAGFHATPYDDFADLHAAYERGEADLVFASAADATHLVRDRGYLPIIASQGVANEATVVVSDESSIHELTDIGSTLTAAATASPDVERICRILVEPADIWPDNLQVTHKRNAVGVAKAVIVGEVQAGFLSTSALEEMSNVTRQMLRPLISSHIYVVRHSLLASPALADMVEGLRAGLLAMNDNPADQGLMAALGAPNGWEEFDAEEAAFMIDLMDALGQV